MKKLSFRLRTYERTYVCTSPCIRFCLSLPPPPYPPPRTKRCAKRWILKFALNIRKSRVDSGRAPVQGRSRSRSRGAFCGQPGPARTPVSLAPKNVVCARWGDRPRKSKPKPCWTPARRAKTGSRCRSTTYYLAPQRCRRVGASSPAPFIRK